MLGKTLVRTVRFQETFTEPQPRQVLVAEDDAELRRALVEMLRTDGHEVDAVGDGGALVLDLARRAALRRPPVDLILSDVRMPACSGLLALELVRRLHGDVPVVLLTAFADETARGRATELGAVLLDKPVKLSALRGVVAGLLRVAPSRG